MGLPKNNFHANSYDLVLTTTIVTQYHKNGVCAPSPFGADKGVGDSVNGHSDGELGWGVGYRLCPVSFDSVSHIMVTDCELFAC